MGECFPSAGPSPPGWLWHTHLQPSSSRRLTLEGPCVDPLPLTLSTSARPLDSLPPAETTLHFEHWTPALRGSDFFQPSSSSAHDCVTIINRHWTSRTSASGPANAASPNRPDSAPKHPSTRGSNSAVALLNALRPSPAHVVSRLWLQRTGRQIALTATLRRPSPFECEHLRRPSLRTTTPKRLRRAKRS